MANEDNDFLTSWAAQAPAPAADGGDTDAGDAGSDDDELGGEGGDQGGNSADIDTGGTADDDASPPAGDEQHQEDRNVPLTALKSERQARKEEREKREAAERRIKELEDQLKAPPQQRQQQAQPEQRREAPPPKDFWEDPVAFVEQRVDGVRQEYEARANQQQQAEFRRAENAMRKQHADFDEVSQIVMEEAQRNPAIVPAIFQSEDPAQALYALGKEIRDFRQFQTDPQSARARMKEELKAELLAELGGNAAAAPAPAPSNNARRPVDLSNKRNAASASASAPPDQFNELFKRG